MTPLLNAQNLYKLRTYWLTTVYNIISKFIPASYVSIRGVKCIPSEYYVEQLHHTWWVLGDISCMLDGHYHRVPIELGNIKYSLFFGQPNWKKKHHAIKRMNLSNQIALASQETNSDPLGLLLWAITDIVLVNAKIWFRFQLEMICDKWNFPASRSLLVKNVGWFGCYIIWVVPWSSWRPLFLAHTHFCHCLCGGCNLGRWWFLGSWSRSWSLCRRGPSSSSSPYRGSLLGHWCLSSFPRSASCITTTTSPSPSASSPGSPRHFVSTSSNLKQTIHHER